jgi:RNA polymerase sigma factor (sigma-70 family)
MPGEFMMHSEAGEIRQDAAFVTTLWTAVLQAGQTDSPIASAALDKLCRAYWYPLYVFVRRQGSGPEEAQDLTQEFFCRILQKNYLQSADRNRGRFRSFLLASLKNFLANEWNRSQRLKRGGGAAVLSMDAEGAEQRYALEAADSLTPERAYQRRWAQTLVEKVMTRLRDEFVEEGKPERFELFKAFLVDDSADSQAEIGTKLGLSESAVKSGLFRMRQRYGELFREEIGNTVASSAEVDSELRELFAALAN